MDNTRLKQIGEEFGQAVAELVNRGLVRIGTVESTDESFANIVLTDGDKPIRVPLQLLKLEKALLRIKPKKDSTVAVLFVEGAKNMPMLIGLTEVEEYKLQVGESSIRVEDKLIEFNGGDVGMVLADKLTDRLNKLQSEITQIQTAIMAHTHPTPSGASGTPTYTKVTVSRFDVSEYANDKITQ